MQNQIASKSGAPSRSKASTSSRALVSTRHERTIPKTSLTSDVERYGRRTALAVGPLLGFLAVSSRGAEAKQLTGRDDDKDFKTLPSGLKVLDVREGKGAFPKDGDTVEVHWAGFTAGYQGKRIDNTSVRDEPFSFVIGQDQVIKGFEEAVRGMKAGGLRRIEIPGECEELGYSLQREVRFDGINHYRYGPQPKDFDGQRALDFVLDNPTLRDFNRNLVFDIRVLAIR